VKPFENLPTSFWCLMTKGEKYQLKLEGSTLSISSSVLFGKTRLSGFANRTVWFLT
jgi:hypothetical protein